MYGSGSGSKKTFCCVTSLNDVHVATQSNKQKYKENFFVVAILKATDKMAGSVAGPESESISSERYRTETDPRIRIRTKMSQIRNTDLKNQTTHIPPSPQKKP
jgi:hypothetical protein